MKRVIYSLSIVSVALALVGRVSEAVADDRSATLTAGLCSAAEPTADFYVSPNGSDAWSGTFSAPNAQRTDGPFETLERARDAVRDFLKQNDSCWVENSLPELDEPGEWVLNTKEGKLYLWPRNDSPVLAPRLTELIRIEGEIDKEGPKDTPVRNLCFRGLTFMHGERYQLASDDAGLQHDWDMHDKANALVRLRGTENCTIEQCRFAHSGSGAIRVDLRRASSGKMRRQAGKRRRSDW